MNIIDEFKTIFRIKSAGESLYKEATQMDGVKPGWKTSEFWIKVLTLDIPMILGLVKGIPGVASIAPWVLLGSNLGYMAIRSWVKRGAIAANLKAFLLTVKSGDLSKIQAFVDAMTASPTPAQ